MGDLMTRNQRLRRILTALLAALMLMTACAPAALATSFKATINSSSARVYSSPSTSSKYSLPALKNATVTVTGYAGGWARISYKGRTLYAKLDDIIFNKHVKAVASRDTSIRFVTKESYAQNTYYSATLSAGTSVYVVGKSGDKLLVTNASDSALGYVDASALSKG